MMQQGNAFSRDSLSILLPILNGAKYISSVREHLNKIGHPKDEFLLIDDGSQDNTWKMISAWAKEDERVVAIQNPNKGLANALNLGLDLATKDWVARFDIDDKYELNRLNLQMTLSSPTVGVIFSDYDFIARNGTNLGVIPSPVDKDATAISLINSRRTPHPSAVINRQAALSVGGYLQADFPAEDLSLWLRMSRVSDLVTFPATLLHYQVSESSVTSTRRQEMLRTKKRLIREIGINSQSIKSANLRAKEIFESYLDNSLIGERQLFFLLELYNVEKRFDFTLAFANQTQLSELMRGMNSSVRKALSRRFLS
jgi:glycosyltransferase involved in cell wall biosynthesis